MPVPLEAAYQARIRAEAGRVFRFAIVGILATATYYVGSLAMVETAGLAPVPASIIGQLCAVSISYFGHALYSFNVERTQWIYFRRFAVVAIATFGVNIGVTWFLSDVIHLLHQVTFAIVSVLIPTINYVCNRFWVFSSAAQETPNQIP